MTYMRQWKGSTDLDDESGVADYMVEGELFSIHLPSLEHAKLLDALLWTAFRQGKSFAFAAIKGHLSAAIEMADRTHELTMTYKLTPRLSGPAQQP